MIVSSPGNEVVEKSRAATVYARIVCLDFFSARNCPAHHSNQGKAPKRINLGGRGESEFS